MSGQVTEYEWRCEQEYTRRSRTAWLCGAFSVFCSCAAAVAVQLIIHWR